MRAFGFWEKDEVVRSIEILAEKEKVDGKSTREIIASILEAANYAVDMVLFNELEKDVK